MPKHPMDRTPNGLVNASLVGGYYSDGLIDLHRYTFSLCELCLRRMIFVPSKIPPKVESLTDGMQRWEAVSFAEDQTCFEFHEWQHNGGHATARLHGLCNAVKGCPNTAVYSVALSDRVGDDCLCAEHKDRWDNCLNATLVPFQPMDGSTRDVEAGWPIEDKDVMGIYPREVAEHLSDVLYELKGSRRILVHSTDLSEQLPKDALPMTMRVTSKDIRISSDDRAIRMKVYGHFFIHRDELVDDADGYLQSILDIALKRAKKHSRPLLVVLYDGWDVARVQDAREDEDED